MRSLRLVCLVALAFGVGLCASGCSPKKVLLPNLPPKTQLFVHYDPSDGVTHSVNHIVHLYWFGSDPDGFVSGYDIRFIWPGVPTTPAWTRTTRTDSVFVVPDTTGLVIPVFEVRAVDNQGLADPAPARQEFSFSNQAPVVTLLDPPGPGETTFATQTIDWSGVDPDGDAGLLVYRVWLDGNEANPHILTGTEFTFPSSDFLRNGRWRTEARTAYVQAVDVGGRTSVIRSATWQVRAPAPDTLLLKGRLLVVDDITSSGTNGDPSGNYDRFYDAAVTRSGIPANSWSLVNLETVRAFRSSKDLEQSLELFDAVVWYRGSARFDANRDTLLARHSDALGAYLDGGGKLYLEALDMVASGTAVGLLSEGFMRSYLASDFLYRNKSTASNDSTVIWSISRAYIDTVGGAPVTHPAILHSSGVFTDSLRSNAILGGLRAFGVRDTHDVVLWARDSALTERQAFDAPVAVRASAGGGGLVVATSVPIPPMAGYPGSTNRFVDKIFQYLGIEP